MVGGKWYALRQNKICASNRDFPLRGVLRSGGLLSCGTGQFCITPAPSQWAAFRERAARDFFGTTAVSAKSDSSQVNIRRSVPLKPWQLLWGDDTRPIIRPKTVFGGQIAQTLQQRLRAKAKVPGSPVVNLNDQQG